MWEDPLGQLDDVEKGERLKCIFEILNKDKKRYERMKATRNLSQIEQKEYEDVCAKLTAFYEKCRAFIKPRKNGPGKFIVQTYVTWCTNQKAMAKCHQFQSAQPPEVLEKESEDYRSDILVEKPIGVAPYGTPHMQRRGYDGQGGGQMYEQSGYRGMGYGQEGEHMKNEMIQKTRTGMNKYPSPYFGGKMEERMGFDPKDPRFEFDPRRMRNFQMEDMRRQQAGHQLAGGKSFYGNGSQIPFQGFNQVGNFSDFKGYPIKAQQGRSFSFPNDHMPLGGFYNMQPQYQVPFGMEEGMYDNAGRNRKEQFPAKQGPPHGYHVQIKPGERIPDTGHRIFQKPEMPGGRREMPGGRGVVVDQEIFQSMAPYGNIPQQDMRFGPKMYGIQQKYPYKAKGETGGDKPPEYSYDNGDISGYSKIPPQMYANMQRSVPIKQPIRPWGHEGQSVVIPAKRKVQGDPQPSAEESAGGYSFEFLCETKSPIISGKPGPLNISPQAQRQKMSQSNYPSEGQLIQPYSPYGFKKPLAAAERGVLSPENILVDSSINSKVMKLNEKISPVVSNMYKMAKNFSAAICADPKLMRIERKGLDTLCKETGITNNIPEDVKVSMLIHLDSVLHKALTISGIMAQSREDRKIRLEDLVHGFKKARAVQKTKNNDQNLFKELLLQVRSSKTE